MEELSLHILDLAQNSITAQANMIEIGITEDIAGNVFSFTITDDGCGIPKDMLERVLSPFTTTRTTRDIGLGIPLTKTACEQAGGSFSLESEQGKGTKVTAIFQYDHLDRQPLGDIRATILLLATQNQHIDFIYTHRVSDKEFVFDTSKIKEALGGVPLEEPDVYNWLLEYLGENIESLYS